MPWVFVVTNPSAQQTVREFVLRVAREYTIGRQSPSRIKLLDRAVSRQQAILIVKESASTSTNSQFSMELFIRDVSKFGTSLNGTRLVANSDTLLHDGDRIELGANGSVCRVHWQPFRVALSGASAALAAKVDALLRECGAEMVSTDFDLLVMDQVSTMSQKLLLALVAAVDVVRPEFLAQIVADARAAVDSEPSLPSVTDFAPVLTNADLKRWRDVDGVQLAPVAERRALFRRTLFFFFVQADFDILAAVIERGGGHAIRFDIAVPAVASALRQCIAANIASEDKDEASAVVFVVSDGQSVPTDVMLVAAERGAVVATRSALLQALLTAKPIIGTATNGAPATGALDVMVSRDAASHARSIAGERGQLKMPKVVRPKTNNDNDDDDDDDDGWLSRSEMRTDRSEAVAAAQVAAGGGAVAGSTSAGMDDAQLVVRQANEGGIGSAKRFRKNAPTATSPAAVVGKFEVAREAARPELEQFMRDRELEEKDERRYADQARELFAAAQQQGSLAKLAAKRKR
jgi:hypothetical protein